MKIKYLQKKIPKCEDVMFYDTGTVATITKPNGTVLYLEVSGEVDFNIGDERYRNDQRFEFIDEYKLTDKKLSNLNKADKINWRMNNWFEVVWMPQGGDSIECAIGDVAYEYDEAIELLKSYYDDENI